MKGPEIIARTLSAPAVTDSFGNHWQYHSRSDRHSKVACWAILFDLLQASNLLQQHVRAGKVTFGINRRLNDWETGKKKDLDLVVARTPGPGGDPVGQAFDLSALAQRHGLILTDEERETLADLPAPEYGSAGATVLIALEAKACMTAHVKAKPRLHDELTSSHSIIHGDNHSALAVGFVMINYADSFVSPGYNKRSITAEHPGDPSPHRQPQDTDSTLGKLREVRRRGGPNTSGGGFDAMGFMLASMTNDGSPVSVVTGPPAPESSDMDHYNNMVNRAAHLYDTSFGHIT